MGCLSKDKILAACDTPLEKVLVPEWADGDKDAYVMVKGMTGRERDQWEFSIFTDPSSSNARDFTDYRAKVCLRCMCDDDGNRLFSDKDVEQLSNKNGAALDRVFQVARRLSGLGANQLEKAEKN